MRYLAYLLFIACVLGFVSWKSYGIGYQVAESKWQKSFIDEQSKASALLFKVEEEARTKERNLSIALDSISYQLERNKDALKSSQDAEHQHYLAIAELQFKLTNAEANSSTTSPPIASTRQCDGKTITELSPEIFKYLYDEATRADEVVDQLTACQEILKEERQYDQTSN